MASVAANLVSAALAIAVGLVIGYRSPADAAHWLAVIGLLSLFVLAISWLAAAIGIALRSPEAAQGVTFLISFLPYPSSAFAWHAVICSLAIMVLSVALAGALFRRRTE